MDNLTTEAQGFELTQAQVAVKYESALLNRHTSQPPKPDEAINVSYPVSPKSDYRRTRSTKKLEERSKDGRENDERTSRKRKIIKEKLVSMYDDILRILQSPEYDNNLEQILERAFPNTISSIQKRKKDIFQLDHGIVISGETNAGKSTLINKILEKKLFKDRNRESTATVCKLRSSDEVIVKTETESGVVTKIDVPEIDLGSKEGVKELRKILKTLTDMAIKKDSTKYNCIDIGIPVPLLKGNTIIVDTPGIGCSGTATEKLMEYLSNAVAFIVIINMASAWGMQQDRLPEILRGITNLSMENEIPSFDPSRVIFITNKWDSIKNDSDDSSDDDEEEKTWQSVQNKIKTIWPSVRNQNIFRMNLREVCCRESPSSIEFERFRHILENIIKENENFRMDCHFRYISAQLETMSNGIFARIKLAAITKTDQENKTKEHQRKIKELAEKFKWKRRIWQDRIKTFINEKAEHSLKYMSSDIGKERILNPAKWIPIMKTSYGHRRLGQEVEHRVALYIQSTVRCPEVVEEFQDIKDEILDFCNEMSLEIEKIENELTGQRNDGYEACASATDKERSFMSYTAGAFITPILFPIMAAGAAVSVATGPIALPLVVMLARRKNNRRIINEKYDKCKLTVRSGICDVLETHYGEVFDRIITNVTQRELQRKIDFIERTVHKLSEHREEILADRDRLFMLVNKTAQLAQKLKEIKEMLTFLETDFS